MKDYDVVIIGAGPLGESMAQRLARAKKKVALVAFPGEPESTLLKQTLAFRSKPPLSPEKLLKLIEINYPKGEPKDFEKFEGPGQFISRNLFQTKSETLKSAKFVIASGAKHASPSLPGLNRAKIKTPFQILTETFPPKSVAVLGSGETAIVVSQKLAKGGARVQLHTQDNGLLPMEDAETSDCLAGLLKKDGVEILRQVPQEIPVEAVCLADAFHPNTEGLDLEKIGVCLDDQKAVVINEECRTSAPNIWAVGAVTGPPYEIALEKRQAEVASENVMGSFFSKIKLDLDPIPFVIPTTPPFARVGLTEKGAVQKFGDGVFKKTFPLSKNEAAILNGEETGWIKIVEKKRGAELVGAQILAPHAEEMIIFFDLILRAGIPLSEFNERNHFPFGTYAEALYQSIAAFNEAGYS